MKVVIDVANITHVGFAQTICDMMYESALKRGTGIARRAPEYVAAKMLSGKAIIALDLVKNIVVGFSYIETWGHGKYVANSGLIVNPDYRNLGIAKKIKFAIFNLSRKKFAGAKIFSITTGLAVMKMNAELGFKPVPFSELTDDPEFWKGCKGCKNYDILQANEFKLCLCTGLLYDPSCEDVKTEQQNSIYSEVIIENVI